MARGRARNRGSRWKEWQTRVVRTGARLGRTTASMARKTGRTKSAVRAKASRMRVSLKPKD